jgi:hypothetical protein
VRELARPVGRSHPRDGDDVLDPDGNPVKRTAELARAGFGFELPRALERTLPIHVHPGEYGGVYFIDSLQTSFHDLDGRESSCTDLPCDLRSRQINQDTLAAR